MSEEENLRENDILFQIDMQLYDEFNHKIAGMNDHLGDIYSLRDVEEIENAQKDREIELLRKAIVKQQKEIEELNKTLKCTQNSWYKDTQIIDKIKEILEKYKYTEIGDSEKIIEFYKKMQLLLEGSEDNGK